MEIAFSYFQQIFFAPFGGKNKSFDYNIFLCYYYNNKGGEMHYIEVYDEDFNIETRYSFFAREISKVFEKIRSLNLENKRFKHYFVD